MSITPKPSSSRTRDTPEVRQHPGARWWHGDHLAIGGLEAWLIWSLSTGFVVWLFSIQTGYAIVSPEIQKTAGLTVAQIGLAGATYTWTFALCQFFSGALLDRFGSRPLMTLAVAMVTAGVFLYAQTTTMAVLVAAQIVLALGSSFGFVGAGYIGGQWFPAARYGLMFGLVQTVASTGSAVGQPVIDWSLAHMTWQELLNGFGALGVVGTVLFILVVRNPPRGHTKPAAFEPRESLLSGVFRSLGRCFRNRNVVLSALLAGTSFGAMIAMGTLWGPRLIGARGAEGSLPAIMTALSWFGLALGAPLFNLLSDHWSSRRWPAVVGVLLQAVAVALVLYLPKETDGVAMVLMFTVGLTAGAHMLGFTVAGESVPATQVGSSAAVVNASCFIVGGLLQALPSRWLPATPDLADFRSALLLIPLLLLAGAVLGLFIKETAAPSGGH